MTPLRRSILAAGFVAGLVVLAVDAAAQVSDAPDESSCATCHGAEQQQLAASGHLSAGVTCTACHGGVPGTLVEEEAHAGLSPLPDPRTSVELCGSCHADLERMRGFGLRTDQLSLYWTSRHGERLAESDDPNVATCVSCHGAHEIRGSLDPRSLTHKLNQVQTCGHCHADPARMAPYGLSADGPSRYRDSVHGRDLIDEGHLSSPACSDCHGSHGATPPRVGELGRVCGQCHTVVQGYFEESPHHAPEVREEVGECIACHGDHAVEPPFGGMLLGSEEGHCGSCHRDDGDPARAVAAALHEGLDRFEASIRATEEEMNDAAERGLFIDREHGFLDDARELRVRARSLVHTMSPDALTDLLNRGQAMIDQTRESVEVKSRALRDRALLTSILFVVVLALTAVLWIYRRGLYGSEVAGTGGSHRIRSVGRAPEGR